MYITTRLARSAMGTAAVAAFIASSFLLQSASAALVIIGAPPSVQLGALQSQTDAYLFLESTSKLGAALSVDIASPGFYTSGGMPDDPGVIPLGTEVNSYMLHHESVGNKLSGVTVSHSFPNPILGIIFSDAFLDVTDPILGNPGTSYPTGLAFRGLELPFLVLPDILFWSGNQVFFAIKTNTAAVLDQVRIITAVPEPATIWLAIAAAPLALLLRRRKRNLK